MRILALSSLLLLSAAALAAPPTYRLDWVRQSTGGQMFVNDSGQVLTVDDGGVVQVYTNPGQVESFSKDSFTPFGLHNDGSTWQSRYGSTLYSYDYKRRAPGGAMTTTAVANVGFMSPSATVYGGNYIPSQNTVFRTTASGTQVGTIPQASSGSMMLVNDAGYLAGSTDATPSLSYPWIWRPGESDPVRLNRTVPGEGAGMTRVLDLDASGRILVSVELANGRTRPVVWNPDGTSFAPSAFRPGWDFRPGIMNSSGIMSASFVRLSDGLQGAPYTGIVTPSASYLFTEMDLVGDMRDGYTMEGALDISESGVIVGYATNYATGTARTFRLTPVPEPGTWATLALGAMATLRRRRRA